MTRRGRFFPSAAGAAHFQLISRVSAGGTVRRAWHDLWYLHVSMRMPSVRSLLVFYVLTGAVAGAISAAAGSSLNLEIFRNASLGLLRGADIYAEIPFDLYKYSPTFALLFLPFAWLPNWLAAVAWPAFNFGMAAWGMTRLSRCAWPLQGDHLSQRVLVYAWPGVVLATDGDQSNMLVAGLLSWAVAALLEQRERRAGAALSLAILVKLFPAALALLWPASKRPGRALAWLAAACALFGGLPALVLGPNVFAALLRSWFAVLTRDRGPARGVSTNWSLMHALEYWFGGGKGDAGMAHVGVVQLIGTALFAASALLFVLGVWRLRSSLRVEDPAQRDRAKDEPWLGPACATFVVVTLAYVLLFNHRSESTTFVFSAWAAALYLATEPAPKVWHWALFVLVTLAPGPFYTDSAPENFMSFLLAKRLFHPLRVVPLLVLWLLAQARLFRQLQRELAAGVG